MPDPALHPALVAPLAAFQARTPPRIWSLIITFLGDAILPRGGAVRAGVISNFCGLATIEPGLVRTALSRLVSKGFVARSREGRASYYRLTDKERRAFAAAADRIYGRHLPKPDGRWELAVSEAGEGAAQVRAHLADQRFRPVSSSLFLRPRHMDGEAANIDGALIFEADTPSGMASLAARLWPLEEIARAYTEVIDRFSAFASARLAPPEAILARVLLAHEFRRVLLRDPFLPPAVLPAGWPADEARRTFDSVHAALTPAAEAWLDAEA